MSDDTNPSPDPSGKTAAERRSEPSPAATATTPPAKPAPAEIGRPSGPEPTRFGDWERNGRCTDF